jgi:hypothetical protein
MPKVQVKSKIEIDFDEVLNGVAQLKINELEQFADRVIALRARRRAPSLSGDEAQLLQKINAGLPTEVWRRYEELNAKLHEETITPEEHTELLELIDKIELADAERMKHLIELAQLRNVSVEMLMDQLGLRRNTYA